VEVKESVVPDKCEGVAGVMLVSTKIAVIGLAIASSVGVTSAHVPDALRTTDSALAYLIGVGLQAFVASSVGATIGTLMAEPLTPRTRMWAVYVGSMVLGAMTTWLVPKIHSIAWLVDMPVPMVGFVAGLLGRWILPALVDSLPGLVKGLLAKVVPPVTEKV